ncbi:hypothetical protein [Nonomuraea sp. LPB2021202275-12-8]|uniref:hypothetical protein n=1 Tax=Nonomuraea sp. LPB2021202275-12-8 TaxID=3120159 RepID=UPI00300D2E64
MYTSPPEPSPSVDPSATPQVPFGAAMRDATRYMSVAAYLDPSFRETALHELVRNRHRGVAPSHGGFDVVPVLRHCLRARSFLIMREVVLTLVLVGGLIFLTEGTIQVLAAVLPLALLTVRPLRGLPRPHKFFAWLILSVLVSVPATLAVIAVLSARVLSFGVGTADDLPTAAGLQVQLLIMMLLPIGVAVGYRIAVYHVISRRLRPGTPPPHEPSADAEVEQRLQWIGAAQHGNVTLYSGRNPFLGAGDAARAWTIAVEMDRTADARDSPGPVRPLVEIDPLELHTFVRERLAQMSARSHPAGIINLRIRDQIVATGRFNQLHGWNGSGPALHPLVEPGQLRPWTGLPDPVIAAVIRSPQAGARHYQRLDINSEGPSVLDPAGRTVIPAEDRGTSVTAFVHLAVEGRMLYTEFVVTVLPPVARAYRSVDELPLSSPPLLAYHALRGRSLYLFRDIAAAPLRLLRMGWQAFRHRIGVDDPRAYTAYDYGARLSLRELGAAERADTLIQELDTFKYTKLVEERLTSAVLDFLEDKGVDTAAYRRQATAVSVSATMHQEFSGDFSGAQFGGPGSQFSQNVNMQRAEGGA